MARLVVEFLRRQTWHARAVLSPHPLRAGALSRSEYFDKAASPVSHLQRDELEEATQSACRNTLEN
ncbi:MAG: hypothetical protein WAL40_01070, partial [Rhodoplanes sp.]